MSKSIVGSKCRVKVGSKWGRRRLRLSIDINMNISKCILIQPEFL